MHFSVLGRDVAIFTDAYSVQPMWVLCDGEGSNHFEPVNTRIVLTSSQLCLVRVLIVNKGQYVSEARLQALAKVVDSLVWRTKECLKKAGAPTDWLVNRKNQGYAIRFASGSDTLDLEVCDAELRTAERAVKYDGFDDPLLIIGDSQDQTAIAHSPRTVRDAIGGWYRTLEETVLTSPLPRYPRGDALEDRLDYLWGEVECAAVLRLKRRAMRLRALLFDFDRKPDAVVTIARQLSDLAEEEPEIYDALVAEAAVRADFPANDTPEGGCAVLDRWFFSKRRKLTTGLEQFFSDISTSDRAENEAACVRWRKVFETRGLTMPGGRDEESPPKREVLDEGRLGWEKVEEGLNVLVAALRDWQPDLIVGINRGGAIVGGMLAKRMGIRTIGVIALVSAQSQRALNAIQFPQDDPNAQRILIVDEAYRTSRHCGAAVEHLSDKSRFPLAEVKTGMLVRMKIHQDERDPIDYYAFETPHDVRFPWDA